jgi:hypothetical protein
MDRRRRVVPLPHPAVRSLVVAAALLVAGCLPDASRGGGSTTTSAASRASAALTLAAETPSGPTPSPSFVRPTPTPLPTFLLYTVARGDSLGTIAKRFGTTARSIAFWNRDMYPTLDPEGAGYRPNVLQVGWTLRIIPNAVLDEQTLPEPSDLVASAEPSATDGAAP